MSGPVEQFLRNISNENDPGYDEDAAVCECGHTFREHWGRAFNYACASRPCECKMFHGAVSGTTSE